MAATTRFGFSPYAAEFPATAFPQLTVVNARPVVAFDAATVEACYWTAIAPTGLTGALVLKIFYMMASGVTGKVDFEVSVEAITDGDATDLDAGTSFDSVNAITAPTVPGTAGYIDVISCTLPNAVCIAVGDYFRVKLERDADDGTNDTAAGDCYVLGAELSDGN